jgi:hypothetical protein
MFNQFYVKFINRSALIEESQVKMNQEYIWEESLKKMKKMQIYFRIIIALIFNINKIH